MGCIYDFLVIFGSIIDIKCCDLSTHIIILGGGPNWEEIDYVICTRSLSVMIFPKSVPLCVQMVKIGVYHLRHLYQTHKCSVVGQKFLQCSEKFTIVSFLMSDLCMISLNIYTNNSCQNPNLTSTQGWV